MVAYLYLCTFSSVQLITYTSANLPQVNPRLFEYYPVQVGQELPVERLWCYLLVVEEDHLLQRNQHQIISNTLNTSPSQLHVNAGTLWGWTQGSALVDRVPDVGERYPRLLVQGGYRVVLRLSLAHVSLYVPTQPRCYLSLQQYRQVLSNQHLQNHERVTGTHLCRRFQPQPTS